MSQTATTLPPNSLWFRRFLVDYRVVISFILFTTLIVAQVYVGMRPRGWWIGGDLQGTAGASLVLIGLVIRSWAAGVLKKGKILAVIGPYSLCRHPLYLGSFCMMLGFCLVVGNPLHLVVVLGPVAVIYWFTMLSEERKLADRFPESWNAYAARVPRFLPWRWSRYVHAPVHFEQWTRNREYKALLTAVAGLVALEAWRLF